MNKLSILTAFASRGEMTFNGIRGAVQSVEHETGSSNAWNVKVVGDHGTYNVFVRFNPETGNAVHFHGKKEK